MFTNCSVSDIKKKERSAHSESKLKQVDLKKSFQRSQPCRPLLVRNEFLFLLDSWYFVSSSRGTNDGMGFESFRNWWSLFVSSPFDFFYFGVSSYSEELVQDPAYFINIKLLYCYPFAINMKNGLSQVKDLLSKKMPYIHICRTFVEAP